MTQEIINNKHHRIGYIDAIRGFAIFSVVFSHEMWIGWGKSCYDSLIGQIIYSYFLPIFFFISGFLAYKIPGTFTVKKTLNLLTKRFFELIVTLFAIYVVYQLVYGHSVLDFLRKGFAMYWFTLVLFECLVVYYIIAFVSKHINAKWLDTALLVVLSIVLVGVLIFLRPDDNRLWTVLCLENFTKYFQFLAFGLICSKYKDQFLKFAENQIFIAIVFASYAILMYVFMASGYGYGSLPYHILHDEVLRYLGILVVFLIFHHFKAFFETDKPFSKIWRYMGRKSLDIYYLHYFFLFPIPFLLVWIDSSITAQLTTIIISSAIVVLPTLGIDAILCQSKILSKLLFGR